jgi:hypothetical protein
MARAAKKKASLRLVPEPKAEVVDMAALAAAHEAKSRAEEVAKYQRATAENDKEARELVKKLESMDAEGVFRKLSTKFELARLFLKVK